MRTEYPMEKRKRTYGWHFELLRCQKSLVSFYNYSVRIGGYTRSQGPSQTSPGEATPRGENTHFLPKVLPFDGRSRPGCQRLSYAVISNFDTV